eukprot:2048509-Rhodomonas_salina.3
MTARGEELAAFSSLSPVSLFPHSEQALFFSSQHTQRHQLTRLLCSHSKICDRYDVDGYPSLRVLSSTGENLREYRGGRTGPTIA